MGVKKNKTSLGVFLENDVLEWNGIKFVIFLFFSETMSFNGAVAVEFAWGEKTFFREG